MLSLRKKSMGILLFTIFALSGCTGGCWKEIEIRKVFDQTTVTGTIHNITRTDLVEISWLITEFDSLVANVTSAKKWTISDENYTLMRNVFISIGVIKNSTASSGKGSGIDSSYNYLMFIYLRFEGIVVKLEVVNWCGS
ncbi:MAG: hypothetical protein ACXAB2_02850 [Candidatus Hodarchaeales archaeon]|jgi:hypothetical protein